MDESTVLIRPPSEANSLLLPVTMGCSNNTCTFCGTYNGIKFKVRNLANVKQDIDGVAQNYSWSVRRVFLENGDALIAPQHTLAEVLKHLNSKFPHLQRIGTYATPRSALIKTVDELKELNRLGLKIAYLGVETGDEELILKVKKGVNYDQMVEAGRKLKEAGITSSVTIILGLGGVEGSEKHALKTARILNNIDPDFVGALVLGLSPGTEMYQDWKEGRFTPISPLQTLVELKTIIEKSSFTNCFFTANHASNYLPMRLRLPQQKDEAVKLLDDIITKQDTSRLRPQFLRAY